MQRVYGLHLPHFIGIGSQSAMAAVDLQSHLPSSAPRRDGADVNNGATSVSDRRIAPIDSIGSAFKDVAKVVLAADVVRALPSSPPESPACLT